MNYHYACPVHSEIQKNKKGSRPTCRMALEKQKDGHGHGSNDHDKHAGHSPNIFKRKFWISFFLTPAVVAALLSGSAVVVALNAQLLRRANI